MNNAEDTAPENEDLIYDAVKDLTQDQLDQTVRKNAAARNFYLTDEHLSVIHSLIEHYQRDCKTHDCLAAHEHMRFLEEAYIPKAAASIFTGCLTPYLVRAACSCLFMNSPVCLH